LRDGVKVQVEGYVNEGKTIKLFHVFTKSERAVIEGTAPGGGGFTDMLSDMAGFQNQGKIQTSKSAMELGDATADKSKPSRGSSSTSLDTDTEAGGGAVIFKPSSRVILPSSDINLDFERRNKASMGWTMVTAVAHVWFKMDGIKGSSRKGTRALDRLAVVWKACDPEPGSGRKGDIIHEPGPDSPVPQMKPADWKGGNETSPGLGKDLGLRIESPASANVSKASSIKSSEVTEVDTNSMEGVKPSGPTGEEDLDVSLEELPQPHSRGSTPTLTAVNAGLDTASATTPQRGSEV
jgi:protein-tyrosine phosphatase